MIKIKEFTNFLQYVVSCNIKLYKRYKISGSFVHTKPVKNNLTNPIQPAFYSIYDIKLM